jgi:hypothetical protein
MHKKIICSNTCQFQFFEQPASIIAWVVAEIHCTTFRHAPELYMDYFGPGAMIDSSFRAADAAYNYVLAPAADAAYGYGLAAVAGAASRGRKVRNVIPSRRLTNKDDSEPEPEPTRLNNKARLEIFKQHLIDKRDNESLD